MCWKPVEYLQVVENNRNILIPHSLKKLGRFTKYLSNAIFIMKSPATRFSQYMVEMTFIPLEVINVVLFL